MPDRTPPDRKYVRVYYSIIEDERFATVYGNDRALAAWLRLLMTADATWPAPAPLPRWLRAAPLGMLVDCGLVERIGQDHYRIHGLEAERAMRSQSARNAAASRWHSGRNADPMPRRAIDEQSIDKGKQGAQPLERARALGVVDPEGKTA